LRNGAAQRGAHRRGGGRTAVTLGRSPARRRGSGGRKTSEVDAWAMRDECATLGRGRMRRTVRGERKKYRPAGDDSVLTGSGGEGGLRGGRIMEAERERERGAGAAWRTVGSVRQWRTTGSVRRRSTWLTGGPRRYGGPVVDRWGR
jgi:hypothetical protein